MQIETSVSICFVKAGKYGINYSIKDKNVIMMAVMKLKRLILIVICLLITGCQTVPKADNKYVKQYQVYAKKLTSQKKFIESSDEFTIKLILNKLDENKTRYDIIIDTPKINMYHLQAIAKVENDDESSLPSLGILEDEQFSLVCNVVDKAKGIYRGVNLSGITEQKKISVIVYLTFYRDEDCKNKEERFIRLDDDALR